jgi:hypothetical protein
MSTKAGTLGFSGRSSLFTLWTVTVSVLAAAALVLSGLALNVASRGDRSEGGGTVEVASIGSPLWDAGKLEAMEARMDLAEAAQLQGTSQLWDEGKLEAMEARMLLAEAAQGPRTSAP